MAEIRNNFIKSKMNKDLDARLVPPGEYRDAQNVSISRSEGEDVGALENILGNISLTDFGYTVNCNIDIIGTYMDTPNDRIIVFMTNYVDTSGDQLSNFATANAICSIGSYNINTQLATVIVNGRFLNFSKTQPIYGVNMIEDLLFWTDNRSQPRKINVKTALANPSYYTSEDHISVAKIYPYQPILLYKDEVIGCAITNGGTGGTYILEDNCLTTGGDGVGLTLDVTKVNGLGQITGVVINNPGSGYEDTNTIGIVQRGGSGSGAIFTLDVDAISTMQDVTSPFLPNPNASNPLYNPNWPGDPDYLKERFARFSYRFKFDDNEYSLIAPFTQECFVPEQDGYFIGDDEDRSYKSTEVGFVVNKVDNILLQIPTPDGGDWDEVDDSFKISEIDILYKEAGQTTIKVVDTIPFSVLDVEGRGRVYYQYEYQSNKPWKTLPAADLLRVYDQVPVRALAQEVGGNRVIYGNYIDKPTPPVNLNYTTATSNKLTEAGGSYVRKEYQNHTLKQNRSYQVGVILCDRYGRQSTVLLSELDTESSSTVEKGSTIFHPFKVSPFSTYPNTLTTDLLTTSDTWPGDSLKVTFIDTITSTKSSVTGQPGLYDATTNPLGWYSYKIVVKQTEQDYYNIYFPGILNGYIDGESKSPTAASDAEPVCHFVLHADNINKVPRDLSLVGPNQTTFRTGRPSPQEDPSYYIFEGIEDGMGVSFDADPYTEEGERRLKERDRLRDLDSGSQITNASVKLSPRVENASIVLTLSVSAGGSGYVAGTYGVTYTGGSGSGAGTGLTVLTTGTGAVTGATIVNPGKNYQVGDVVVIDSGGNNATITINTVSGTNNVQSYPGVAEDVVTTIGTGSELGLWDPAVNSPYDTAPVFYGYENNPYVAKVIVSDSNIGVTGPSPDAGKYIFCVRPNGVTTAARGTNYVAGSKNASTKVDPTPADPDHDGITGVLFDINAIDTQNAANPPGPVVWDSDVGAGPGNLIDGGCSIANNDGAGIKGVKKTDNNVKFLVLLGDGLGKVGVDITRNTWPGLMSPTFAVYETEPIESKLDIYWETSTSGLVSTLNTAIIAGGTYDAQTPTNLFDSAGNAVTYTHPETIAAAGTVTEDFIPFSSTGADLKAFSIDADIISVTDKSGADWTSAFSISSGSLGGSFKITTDDEYYYGAISKVHHNWDFLISIEVESSSYASDGSTITVTLPLTTSKCALSNVTPIITVPGGTPSGDSTGDLLVTITGENGSVNSTLEVYELTWAIHSSFEAGTSTDAPYFYIVNTTDGEIELWNLNGTPVGSYDIKISLTDGGGLSAISSTITVIIR